jgi:hypothetical protein
MNPRIRIHTKCHGSATLHAGTEHTPVDVQERIVDLDHEWTGDSLQELQDGQVAPATEGQQIENSVKLLM